MVRQFHSLDATLKALGLFAEAPEIFYQRNPWQHFLKIILIFFSINWGMEKPVDIIKTSSLKVSCQHNFLELINSKISDRLLPDVTVLIWLYFWLTQLADFAFFWYFVVVERETLASIQQMKVGYYICDQC